MIIPDDQLCIVQYLGTKTGSFSSWLKFHFTSLSPTLRTQYSSKYGSNWWKRLVLGTLFPALTASTSFKKYLAWHILIISVSAFCNIELSWYDSSDVWSWILWHCLFCLIIFSSFSLYWINMATIFFSFFNQIFSLLNKIAFHNFMLSSQQSASVLLLDLH